MAYQSKEELLKAFTKKFPLGINAIEYTTLRMNTTYHEDIVISALEGTNYDGGALERAASTAECCAKVLTQLMFFLIEKKRLTPKEAAEIVSEGVLL